MSCKRGVLSPTHSHIEPLHCTLFVCVLHLDTTFVLHGRRMKLRCHLRPKLEAHTFVMRQRHFACRQDALAMLSLRLPSQVFRGSISAESVCNSTLDCSDVGSLEPQRCMDESECEKLVPASYCR